MQMATTKEVAPILRMCVFILWIRATSSRCASGNQLLRPQQGNQPRRLKRNPIAGIGEKAQMRQSAIQLNFTKPSLMRSGFVYLLSALVTGPVLLWAADPPTHSAD